MSDGRAISGSDRLPWLTDDVPPATPHGFRVSPWAVAAILLIAAISYWFGAHGWSIDGRPSATSTPPVRSSQTIALPDARMAEPVEPEVTPAPQPDVAPVAVPAMPRLARDIPLPKPKASRRIARESATATATITDKIDPLALWPVRVIDGASGRLVRVGAFSSVHQAKKGWWAIVRLNPSLQRLPALVVPVTSLRDSRTYYRLQMGTTSQAHSEVLCQRMRMIGQSCVVIAINDRGAAAK